jgi:quinol monooxygenase YgiN
MPIRCVARVVAIPDRVEALRKLLLQLLKPTRAEPGCIRYELLQNLQDPTDFTFVEEWRDEAAITAHMGTPHVREVLARVPELLRQAPDIRTYEVVG